MPTKDLNILVRLRDAASKGLEKIDRGINGLGRSAQGAVKGVKSMHAALVTLAAAAAGGALFGKSIKDFATFDDNMRAAAAVTQATEEQLKSMTETALRMGQETRYTATESAEALRFLGMAGFEASEATAALPGTLELAAAGALDLGQAADITTNILSGFGLEVEQLGRVNDVLVGAFTSANVNLTEIGEAFKMVGPIAKGVGADFEDLIAAIANLGNAGIKGTLAGTALKNTIDALLAPTAKEAKVMKEFANRIGQANLEVKDSEGNFIGFHRVIQQLSAAGARGDEILQAFGMRAGPGLAALMNIGADATGELADKFRGLGDISGEIAGKMEAGIGGEVRRSVAVFESLRLAIGDAFGPATIDFLIRFQEIVKDVIVEIKRLAEGGEIESFAQTIISLFEKVNTVVGKTYRVIRVLGSVLANVLAVTTGDVGIMKEALKGLDEEVQRLMGTWDIQDEFGGEGVVVGSITAEMNAARKVMEDAAKKEGPIGRGAEKVKDAIKDAIKPQPTEEASLKAALVRLSAILKQEQEKIKGQYDQKLVSLDQYFQKREEIVTRRVQKEIEILRAALKGEEDVNKIEIINAQIEAKEKDLQTAIIALQNERVKAQESLDKKQLQEQQKISNLRLRAEKAHSDQAARIKEEGTTTLDTQFAKEMADLQTKQNQELETIRKYHDTEIQALKDANATKEQIDQAYRDKKSALDEQQRLQFREKEQQAADQALRLQEYKINNLKTIAAGAASAFEQLYELGGKKSKEFFYLAKAASIAEATMNVAQGITKAMAQGGIWGIAQGAIIAAAGAAQIATIASQGLASGGMVEGKSPNKRADDKLIRATSGEYMMNVDSVRHYGTDFMDSINKRRFAYGGMIGKRNFSRFADGGVVTPGASGSNGQGQAPGFNIINVVDPSMLDQYLASSQGQDAVLNVIGARPEAAQRMLKGA